MNICLAAHLRLLGLLGLLLLASSAAMAAEVKLTVTPFAPDTTTEAVAAVLTAKPIVLRRVGVDSPANVVAQFRIPGRVTLQLGDGVIWALYLKVPGYWAPPAYVEAGRGEEPALQLYPTGYLRGTFATEDQEPLPTQLEARFQSETAGNGGEPLEGHIACSVETRNWSCEIPVGRFDLRLRAPSFISHYLWQREITSEKAIELSPMLLKRGASVVGWVETEGSAPLDEKPAQASLTPLPTQITDPREKDQEKRFSLAVQVSPRGFLHLEGVAPGSYVLEVEQPGIASARVRPLIIEKNEETEIDDPIVLRRPLALEIQIEPTVDMQAGAWTVEIHQANSLVGALARGRTNAEGLWRQPGLSADNYNVAILDSRGSRVAYEAISLVPEETRFHIELPILWVEGRVTLGDDEPLSARLAFGGFKKFVSVEFESDENGEFSGFLPRPGLWKIDVKSKDPFVYRRLRDIEVKRSPQGTMARVELEIPDTVLEGKTMDENGRPVASAQVLVVPYSEGEELSYVLSDRDGEFRFHGFKQGNFKIEALGVGPKKLRSDPVDVEMENGSKRQFVQLILREMSLLKGTVRSPAGSVSGAQVQVNSLGGTEAGMIVPSARSDVRGQFALEMQGLPSEIDVKVMAPGFTLQRFRTWGDPSETLDIHLDQEGGTLTLLVGDSPEVTVLGTPNVLIFYRDVEYHFGDLSQWAFINRAYQGTKGQQKIPMMPAGYYTICPGSVLPELRGSSRSTVFRSNCEMGFLAPSGELVLPVPWSRN